MSLSLLGIPMLFNFVQSKSFPQHLKQRLQEHPGPQKIISDGASQQSAELGELRDMRRGEDEFLYAQYGNIEVIVLYVYHKARSIYYKAETLERLGDDRPGFYDWLAGTDPDYSVAKSLKEFEAKYGFRPH